MKRNIFKRALCLVLMILMISAIVPLSASAADTSDFTDVKPAYWYFDAVDYATRNGLFAGTSKTTFSPNGSMTRGMFVTVLGRLAGVDTSKYLFYRFDDVKPGSWYAPYVEWAAGYGIVSGTGDKTFSPNLPITREQMAAILYRYAQKTENDTRFGLEAYNTFSDAARVSKFAQEAMQWATDKGILNGSDGKLDPKATASRAQVAQVFLNARDVLVKNKISAVRIPVPADEKTDPDNIFNVFEREYDAAKDWKVSSKSRMAPDEQALLISLLQGKTGDMVWNDIALEGMTIGCVGETRKETLHGDNGDFHTRFTSIEEIAKNILNNIDNRNCGDVKYFCIDLGDFINGNGIIEQKDIFYDIYFINTPTAFVSSSDSAFTAAVKQKVAERIPSGFVWSECVYPNGGWTDFQFMPWNIGMTEGQLIDAYADFFVYMLTEGYGNDKAGYWNYYINLEPGTNNGHEKLRLYVG